ncbi:hypothetical protein PEB0150_015190 [Bartonella apis]|nr:hypothetical protein PEB0150_015190 [Bartonella apis]
MKFGEEPPHIRLYFSNTTVPEQREVFLKNSLNGYANMMKGLALNLFRMILNAFVIRFLMTSSRQTDKKYSTK